jgi:hypothetical protein
MATPALPPTCWKHTAKLRYGYRNSRVQTVFESG